MTELKKCPFCGGEPFSKIKPIGMSIDRDTFSFSIKCSKCGVEKYISKSAPSFNFEEVERWIKYTYDEWNRRSE